MESLSSKKVLEQERQAEIRRQIAALQAQLGESGNTVSTPPSSPKRKAAPAGLMVPSTPSPKKKRKLSHSERPAVRPSSTSQHEKNKHSNTPSLLNSRPSPRVPDQRSTKPAPSTVLEKLAKAHSQKDSQPEKSVVTRSTAFTQPAMVQSTDGPDEDVPARDDRLAIVEDLVPGPADHKPPFDDPRFEKLEPNSGIRLSSRSIPFEDFQDYLRGRYYLSPSKLYSVARLLPSKQGYDVPVAGDWLTIAVVAERGKVKYSQAPVGLGRDDKIGLDDDHDETVVDKLDIPLDGPALKSAQGGPRPQRAKKEEPRRTSGKKYVNMKLVDFGCRAARGSANGGQAVIRGDALLSLLLFESDGFDVITRENGKKEKVYRGGSRGAFEKMSTLREGAVVALLNPKILKPFQRSGDAPHPTDNILALTPESAESIAVIGYSLDLGMCKAIRRDGTKCGSWCDRRVADVCDWHIQHAVERKRAGRAEFSSGTSGMSMHAKKKKADYDPTRQWGLKSEAASGGGGATYCVGGHVVAGSNDAGALFLSETMGRDAQARASRKASTLEADRALQQLLKRDKEGTRALATAREFAKKQARKEKAEGKGGGGKTDGKGKGKGKEDPDAETGEGSGSEREKEDKKPHGHSYSASLIKQLGFDPTSKDGRRSTDPKLRSKLDALAALQASKRDIDLAPRPGKKRSCVARPVGPLGRPQGTAPSKDTRAPFLGSDDEDDLEKVEKTVFGKVIDPSAKENLVCLDSSDVE